MDCTRLFTPVLVALALLCAASPTREARAADELETRTLDLGNQIPGPTWYAQALARGGGGLNVTHFWSKGSVLRAETVIGGHRIVTVVRGDTYYSYDALVGVGIAIKRSPEAMAVAAKNLRPFGNEGEALIRQGGEKVREDDIHGRACDVLRVTDGRGKREVWVTKDVAQVPLRMEIYHRRSGTTSHTDYLNWQTGLPLPDQFFRLDPEIEFEHFEHDEYLTKTAQLGPQGPVPVLYADLLSGPMSLR